VTRIRAAAALFLAASSGCASWPALRLERPEVILVDLAPLESTLFEQRVRIDLRVLNPNARPLEVEGLDFELELNDLRVARVLSNEALSVPARGDALLSVTASATVFDLLRQLLAAQRQQRETYAYRVGGRIYLRGLLQRKLRFEQTGSFRGPERLLRELERPRGGRREMR
jgi:LEA14-like dessication related protein